MDKATEEHWNMALRVLKYLNGTKEYGLVFKKQSTPMSGYSDSDFAGDVNDRKSTSGFVFLLNGSAISWRSKKQTVVAQSTTEAEYIAMSYAVREAIWIKSVIYDLKCDLIPEITVVNIKTDNQQVLELSKNEIVSEKSKHIDVKYHLVRDHSISGTIELAHVPSCDMIADTMTKGLNKTKFSFFRQAMGVSEI